MNPEAHLDMPMDFSDPFTAELFGMLDGEAIAVGALALTEAEIDAAVAEMFGTVTDEDLALLGASSADDISVRSLTGNLTAEEELELAAIDARNATAAQGYFTAHAANTADYMRSVLADLEDDREYADA